MKSSAVFVIVGFLVLIPTIARSTTWQVPSQCPTIQAGVDSANVGDTVTVACGIYHDCTHVDPDGRLNCVLMKSGICLRSETGQANCATIDAQGLGRVVYCREVDEAAGVEGFTITGAVVEGAYPGSGGGMHCSASSPIVTNCDFVDNSADLGGGIYCDMNSSPTVTSCGFLSNSADGGAGMWCKESSPTLVKCVFSDNHARYHGGGIFCDDYSSPIARSCTFSGNSTGGHGAGIFCWDYSNLVVENTIISFSIGGSAVYGDFSCSAALSCCDVYGNEGGDWWSIIEEQSGQDGNISENPLFCDGGLYLQECSPCTDRFGCGQIGAYGVSCPCGGPSKVKNTRWSSIKVLYRSNGGQH